MEKGNLISLIIPCYNEQESLPVLYEELSRVAELIKPYEIEMLFVNDGSNDNTKSVILRLSQNDSRVHYYGF